jgi:uncharacterized protein
MLDLVTPDLRLASVLELEVGHLRSLGLDGLLLDVDCTLKDHGAVAFGPEVVAWIRALRAGAIRLCLLSNGRARRIEALARTLEIPFVAAACKPLPFGCRRALRAVGLDGRRAGLVGDQLFADVLAGRLAGLFTILVQPTSPAEPWFTRLKRPPERWILRRIGHGPACPPGPRPLPPRGGHHP